jgi:hypothetical protein
MVCCVLQFGSEQAVLASKGRAVPRYANKCNRMHVNKKVRPCLSRLSCSAQLLNSITVQNSYANRTANVESTYMFIFTDKCLFTPRSNV